MKSKYIQIALLTSLIMTSQLALGQDFVDELIRYFDNKIEVWQNNRIEYALIKSEADLAHFASISAAGFPLNKLSQADKQQFFDSLRFNERGLTSFNYEPLMALSKRDRYQILSLFGFENLSGNLDSDQKEKACIFGSDAPNKCNDHMGYKCIGKGTCVTAGGYICTSNC